GSDAESDESRYEVARFHQGGKGRERPRWNTNVLLHPRQGTLNCHRPSQQRRVRQTITLCDKNGNAPSPEMANPDKSTLIIRPQPSPGNGRARPTNRQVTRTRQRQRRLSSRIQKGTRQRTCKRTLNCRNSSRIHLSIMKVQRD